MTAALLRVYFDPAEVGLDGYPYAWHKPGWVRLAEAGREMVGDQITDAALAALGPLPHSPIKHLIRERDGHRCLRCGHPYPPGIKDTHPRGEWTPCDDGCTHGGPIRGREVYRGDGSWDYYSADQVGGAPVGATMYDYDPEGRRVLRYETEAHWRILTVHHLNGIKHDCRWWNLVSLCQRCHLLIQRKVVMERAYNGQHTEWFRPFVAAFYASTILGEELTREETEARMDELLALQHEWTQETL